LDVETEYSAPFIYMESEVTKQPGGAIAIMAWIEVNRQRLIWGGAALVVLLLVVALFLQQRAHRERKASRAFSDVRVSLNPGAPVEAGAIEALTRVAEDYRGTKAATRALLTSAGLLFAEKKYAEAEARFTQVTKDYPDTPWAPEALQGVAASLEAQGKTAEAIAKYEEIKRRFDKSPVIEDAKLSLARLYEAQKPEEAFKLYDELTKSMPGTRLAMDASSRQEDLLKARPELVKLKESLNPPPAPPTPMPTSPQPQLIQMTNPPASGTSQPVQIKLNPSPTPPAAPATPAGTPPATTAPAPAPAPTK
jgi:tetratricopeptide (TPR) repeat protein